MGVRANRVIAWAFAMSGLLAGAVALLYIAQVGAMTPQFGVQPALIGFVATVVGGLGSLAGAVIGGFLIGTLTVVLQLVLPLELRPFREAFLFGLLFIVLLVRPQGIVVVRWSQERV
jgi:branched-chain amino acid transport system permease protein